MQDYDFNVAKIKWIFPSIYLLNKEFTAYITTYFAGLHKNFTQFGINSVQSFVFFEWNNINPISALCLAIRYFCSIPFAYEF